MTFLTVPEAAKQIRCTDWTVRREIAKGDLRATKVAGKWLIEPSDLERYITAGFNVARTTA